MVLALVLTAFAHAQIPGGAGRGYRFEGAFSRSGYDAQERMMIAMSAQSRLGYYGRIGSELVNIQTFYRPRFTERSSFTVDEDHAVYNGTTPMAPAERWRTMATAIQKYAGRICPVTRFSYPGAPASRVP